ncbi:MAG: reverse transcriptase domain-containing protein [Perlabentimonas sp.]
MSLDITYSEKEIVTMFHSLEALEDVATLLDLSSYKFLEYVIFITKDSEKYNEIRIPKKNNNGETRLIQEPNPQLKIIQHKLLQILNVIYKPKCPVHGFTCGRSIVTNSKAHAKKKYVLNLDLKDFFPSIHFGRVRGMFMSIPYNLNDRVATILAQICCSPNGLPQGAPTSPIISNMICAKLDSQLRYYAKSHFCIYTRYADDISLSCTLKSFPSGIASVVFSGNDRELVLHDQFENIINKNGFKVNHSKTRLQTKDRRQEVTGLVVNEKVNVNRKYIRQVRAILHAMEKFGYDKAENEHFSIYSAKKKIKPYQKKTSLQRVIKGKIEFIGMVRGREDSIFIKLNNKACKLEISSGLERTYFKHIETLENEMLNLIKHGESDTVEFKEGACYNAHTRNKDNNMINNILKSIAAFLNSKPSGTLLIGVKDDHEIVGVEREYEVANPQKSNWDGYCLYLTDKINSSLSRNVYTNYKIDKQSINGKDVCIIKTFKLDNPIYFNNKLYIRDNNKTYSLENEELTEYIMNF